MRTRDHAISEMPILPVKFLEIFLGAEPSKKDSVSPPLHIQIFSLTLATAKT